MIGAFHERSRKEVSKRLESDVKRLLEDDSNSFVRAISARCLTQIKGHSAFEYLKKALADDCEIAAAGAASALGNTRPMTPEILELLKAKARLLLAQEVTPKSEAILSALIGSLSAWMDEDLRRTNQRADETLRRACADKDFLRIFQQTFRRRLTRSSSASVLGKIGNVAVYDQFCTFLEAKQDFSTDRTIASVLFGLQRLCRQLNPSKLTRAVSIFFIIIRDDTLASQLRRPAASALGEIAARGFKADDILNELSIAARDLDVQISCSCIYGMLRVNSSNAFDAVWEFVQGFPGRAKMVCTEVHNNPSHTGLRIMAEILNSEERPRVIASALKSVQQCCRRARQMGNQPPDYASDFMLLKIILRRCIALMTRQPSHPHAIYVAVEVWHLFRVYKLPELRQTRDDLTRWSRTLIQLDDEVIAEAGWRLLLSVQPREGILLFNKLTVSQNLKERIQPSITFFENHGHGRRTKS